MSLLILGIALMVAESVMKQLEELLVPKFKAYMLNATHRAACSALPFSGTHFVLQIYQQPLNNVQIDS